MTWEFDAVDSPVADGDFLRIDPKNCVGHLLLVWAVDYIEDSPTWFSRPDKKSDVIIVDAVDLSARDPDTGAFGLVGRKCWWRQAQLIRDLKASIGKPSPKLAMMTRGTATKGQPPYVLLDMRGNQDAVNQANAWRAANPGFTPSQASGAMYLSDTQIQQIRAAQPANQPMMVQETELERMARMAQQPMTPPPPPPPRDPDTPSY